MIQGTSRWTFTVGVALLFSVACGERAARSVSVPFKLDHNRMLVPAEIQDAAGGWHRALLWVDTGNPEFFISEALARDLGIDLPGPETTPGEGLRLHEVSPPRGVRIGGMSLDFSDVTSKVLLEPQPLFGTMHNDANLPSTVLSRYRVVFDYPRLELTLAEPDGSEPRGPGAPAGVHPETGIVQLDAVIDGESFSFALDNGAAYSLVSADLLQRLSEQHPDWPRSTGALGCANMWGWWPEEPTWPILRVPQILWGPVRLTDVGIAGPPAMFPGGLGLGEWYSHKTARPVDGLLGPNAFKALRVEIDYANGTVHFERGAEQDAHDMDLVGLTLRPEVDGRYSVIGVAGRDGRSRVEGVEAGDRLLRVDGFEVTGATMGRVVDALRGRPGDLRTLLLERDGRQLTVEARVERQL